MSLLTGAVAGVLNLIYPPVCRRCDDELDVDSQTIPLCEICGDDLHYLPKNRCETCGKPVLGMRETRIRCWECRSGSRTFDRAVSVYAYDGTFRKLWHRVKFLNHPEWIDEIVDDALEHVSPDENFNPYQFDVFTWTPTTDRRLAERGYDPAERIAKRLSGKYQRQAAALLKRIRDCPPQMSLARKDRIQNVNGAFAAAVPAGMRTRAALLVDDILTTGSTASACATALKGRGFEKVVLFTLARGV